MPGAPLPAASASIASIRALPMPCFLYSGSTHSSSISYDESSTPPMISRACSPRDATKMVLPRARRCRNSPLSRVCMPRRTSAWFA
eukprot:scaffold8269_cov122-Isochrysis_galbana.AAC.1